MKAVKLVCNSAIYSGPEFRLNIAECFYGYYNMRKTDLNDG